MPARTLGDQRFVPSGENSAGDPMFVRNLSAGDPEQASSDYEDMTKDELSAELESRGLAKSGSKAELVARLSEDDG